MYLCIVSIYLHLWLERGVIIVDGKLGHVYCCSFQLITTYQPVEYADAMTRPSLSEPRPSISSTRSREADFEAALLNPAQTKYISSSPIIDEAEPTFPSRDADAPDPIGKRSFDEDLEQNLRTPVKNVASPSVIPPTPSTAGTERSRTSTSTSGDSGSGRRASRIKPMQAIDMHREHRRDWHAITLMKYR